MRTRRIFAAGCFVVMALAVPAAARPEPDPLTPADAEVMLTVNVRRLLRAPVVKKHDLDPLELHVFDPLGLVLQYNREGQPLRRLLFAAGLNPLKDVDTISVCVSAAGKRLAVVRGRFDADKARAAAAQFARRDPDRLEALPDSKPPMWKVTFDRLTFVAAFAGKNALMVTESKEDTAAAIRRAGQPPQALSKDMQAVLDQLKGGECAWLAAVGSSGAWKHLEGQPWKVFTPVVPSKEFADNVRSVTGSLDLGDDIGLSLVIHTKSPAAADRIKFTLQHDWSLIPPPLPPDSRFISKLRDCVKFDTERSDVRVRLRLIDAQIERARKKD